MAVYTWWWRAAMKARARARSTARGTARSTGRGSLCPPGSRVPTGWPSTRAIRGGCTWPRGGRSTPEGALDGGIYLSVDAGATWRRVLSQDGHIYDVTIDPRDRRVLYAAGFESSAWRSADAGVTWQRIRGFNFKWGHRVIPDPGDRSRIYITTFGGSVWHGPAAGDPKALEDIVGPPLALVPR